MKRVEFRIDHLVQGFDLPTHAPIIAFLLYKRTGMYNGAVRITIDLDRRTKDRLRKRALTLRGTLPKADADRLRRDTVATRKFWR
jgi:hypothetical protein